MDKPWQLTCVRQSVFHPTCSARGVKRKAETQVPQTPQITAQIPKYISLRFNLHC